MQRSFSIQKKYEMLKACGANELTQLNEKSNNRNQCGDLIINPPLTVNIDASQISSLSNYSNYSVLITTGGELQAIGYNVEGSISRSLPLKILPHFTTYIIKDNAGRKCIPISAYTGSSFTLYLVSIEGLKGTYLALASNTIMSKYPAILKTSSTNFVGIFGGPSFAAAIDSEGSIFFICTSIKEEQIGLIEATKLPNGEKAVSVACSGKFVIVLAESNNVFISQTTYTTQTYIFIGVNEFKIVNELKGKRIKQISGVSSACLAVSEDGKVFGYGRNDYLSLGMRNSVKYDKFTEISSLKNYKIAGAYNGDSHSLFRTTQGKILGSGNNNFGQLATKEKSKPDDSLIIETTITSGATFCIVGDCTTYILINCDAPNSPNRRVNLSSELPKQTTETTIKTSATDEEITRLKTEVSSLKKENEKLNKENASMKTENSSLKTEIASLKKENESLKKTTKRMDPSKADTTKMKTSKMRIYDAEEIEAMTRLDSIGRGGQSEVVKVSG